MKRAIALIIAAATLLITIFSTFLCIAADAAELPQKALTAEEKELLDEAVRETDIKSLRRSIDMTALRKINIELADFEIAAGSVYDVPDIDTALDIDILKNIYFNAANKTDSDKLRVWWITEASPEYSEDKSFVFTVEKGTEAKVYNLVLNGIPTFSGKLIGLRLEPLGATSGKYEVTEMRLIPTLRSQMYYCGSVDSVKIQDDKQTVKINGKIDGTLVGDSAEIVLYDLGIWQNSYKEAEPFMTSKASKTDFEFSFGLGDRIYDKFAVIYKNGDNEQLVDEIKFIENPEITAENAFTFPTTPVKKGFHTETAFSDAASLGSRHANLGIQLNIIFEPDGGLEYNFKGKTYYVNAQYLSTVDEIVKTLTDSGCIVTMGFILYKNSKMTDFYHPNAAMTANSIGFNTVTKEGCEILEAAVSFIVNRYTLPDKKYGRVVNWLVGNEVGSAYAWNDMGADYPVDKFVRDYERAVRIIDTTVRRISAEGRTYICFDALWDRALPTTTTDRYDNRVILDMISAYSKASGDYNWNVAHHAYPEVLAKPKFWNDADATESVSSDYVNFKNLHILTDYLRMENNLYNGNARRVILTEQGFNCTANSEIAENVQAAAFAYAYYVCLFDDVVDSFQYYRPIDHEAEAAMAFRTGLRKHIEGTKEDPGEKRRIYDVYKYIDTEKSTEYTDFALEVIGIKSWKDVIPKFDAAKLNIRELSETEADAKGASPFGTELIKKIKDGADLSREEQTQGWHKTFYCSSIGINDDGNTEIKLSKTAGALSRGITYTFDKPQDFSGNPVLATKLKIDNDRITSKVRVQLVAVSGDDMITAYYDIEPQKTEQISVNLADWDGIKSVTSVRLLFIGVDEAELPMFVVECEKLGFYSTMSLGAVVGIAGGAVAAVAVAIFGAVTLKKKKSRKK